MSFAACAYSQPPAPTPPKVGQEKQQNGSAESSKSAEKQTPPQSAPVIVNFFQPANATPVGESSGDKGYNPPPSYWVTLFTAVLAICAFAQVIAMIVQARYMRISLATTGEAARAASASAEHARAAIILTHRPRLTVRFLLMPETVITIGDDMCLAGTLAAFNTGNTKATLTRTCSEIIVSEHLPARPKYEGSDGEPLGNIELAPGQSTHINFPSSGPMKIGFPEFKAIGDRRDLGRIENSVPIPGVENLFVIGWIEYLDSAERPRRVGFCRRYHSGRFEIVHDHDYEYED